MNAPKNKKAKKGVLSTLKHMITHNRLGELLVLKGQLTPEQLHAALTLQKRSPKQSLGHVLIQEHIISRRALYSTLGEQLALRGMIAATTLFISFSALGAKPARAASIKDIPSEIKITETFTKAAYAPVSAYPRLFNSSERQSYDLSAFTKWTGMFDRFETAMKHAQSKAAVRDWQESVYELRGLPLAQMADGVNDIINKTRYITDSRNWGQSDYWATPIEFLTRGGDCEDFAIAKYVSLRALGVPDERLRIAIVQDLQKNIPHAVLIVYTDQGAMLLDNQMKQMRPTNSTDRYKPIFSINRQAWWLHTKSAPSTTVLASAAR